MEKWVTVMGLIAGIVMPLFNIPMILHIYKRKSSQDISFTWLLGVWLCILLMFPSALISTDLVLKVFGILNIILFSAVVAAACRYRKGNAGENDRKP